MKRRWTEQNLRDAVAKSRSYRNTLKLLGLIPAGGNYSQLKNYIDEYKINIDHFTGQGWNVGLKFVPNKPRPLTEILRKDVKFQSYKLKKRLFREGYKQEYCEICGWAEVSEDGRIPLEINHKNGESTDNRIENIEILCPNCHSLKPFYRGSKLKK